MFPHDWIQTHLTINYMNKELPYCVCGQPCEPFPYSQGKSIGRYAGYARYHQAVISYDSANEVQIVVVCTQPGTSTLSGTISYDPDQHIDVNSCLICPFFNGDNRIIERPQFRHECRPVSSEE